MPALQRLKAATETKTGLAEMLLRTLWVKSPAANVESLLARLGLDRPQGLRERITQRMLLAALSGNDG